jgi:uncharacterized protein YndB with AHSA1/START domain
VTENRTLHIERTFDAPVEDVFDAWTSADVIRRWWRVEEHWETREAIVDLRIGGQVRVAMHDPTDGADYGGGGLYTEIDRPNRLAFTWIWDRDPRGTLIEIDFAETDGVTTVNFKHSGLWDEEAVQSHNYGWTGVFDKLENYLAAQN